jgi:hypothetical protein
VGFEDPYSDAGNPFPAGFAPFVPPRDSRFITPLGRFGSFARDFQPSYSDFDVAHRLVISHVWSLPDLRQHKPIARHVLGGWQFSGISTLRSGFPFSVSSGTDRAFSGLGSSFADLVGNPFLDGDRTPTLNNPITTVNTPARFGRMETAGSPRIVQFALRVSF